MTDEADGSLQGRDALYQLEQRLVASMDATSIWPALLLTLLAGLATAIGSAIAFFAPRADTRFLGIALGFSAG